MDSIRTVGANLTNREFELLKGSQVHCGLRFSDLLVDRSRTLGGLLLFAIVAFYKGRSTGASMRAKRQ